MRGTETAIGILREDIRTVEVSSLRIHKDGDAETGDRCEPSCVLDPLEVRAGGRFDGALAAGWFDVFMFELSTATRLPVMTGDGMDGCQNAVCDEHLIRPRKRGGKMG